MALDPTLTLDHQRIEDSRATRAYFRTFARITEHLGRVAAEEQAGGRLTPEEVDALARYLVGLALTFRALGLKYLFAGLAREAGGLTFDRVDSGFPVAAELMAMASDATQAPAHLGGMPSPERLKDDMVRAILGERQAPRRLQFSLSQRLYYEELTKGGLFWARNDPEAIWLGTTAQGRRERRRFLVRWAVFEAADNLPTIYLMEVEDTGREGLPKDGLRWPLVQRHLMAQAVGGLTLLTIARGFDDDFADVHPKRLRRFRVGPLHSASYTTQEGPIRQVLEAARAPEGEDWVLGWTEEDLVSEGATVAGGGWFAAADERQTFRLAEPREMGLSGITRALIMPSRPYQAMAELDPPAFRAHRKIVVGEGGRVLALT